MKTPLQLTLFVAIVSLPFCFGFGPAFDPYFVPRSGRHHVGRHHRHHRSGGVLFSTLQQGAEAGGTLVELENPASGQRVTLVGTAHISQDSINQVKSVIEKVQPDVVMIELDEDRLDRIGLTDTSGINFVTASDIEPPLLDDDIEASQNRSFWSPVADLLLQQLAQACRGMLTRMYDDLEEQTGENGAAPGGEFSAAVAAARQLDAGTKIVLGDRNSVATLRRTAELVLRSGDPLGFISRLVGSPEEIMNELEAKVRRQMEEEGIDDESQFNVRLIESLKTESGLRQKLFDKLSQEVPEFTRAFLTERDYIMAESIRRETQAKHVVGVVGLAHLRGMADNLMASDFRSR